MSAVLEPHRQQARRKKPNSFVRPPFAVRRWTVKEYEQLAELGILTEDDRVELLEGWIVPQMTHNPPHDWTITQCELVLGPHLEQAGWVRRIQCAIDIRGSQPEPDIAVVHGPNDRYARQRPSSGDIALIIEVAETSIRRDRRKARMYAEARVSEYWIINLIDEQIEWRSEPDAAARQYRQTRILRRGEVIPLRLEGKVLAEVPVDQLLPVPEPDVQPIPGP